MSGRRLKDEVHRAATRQQLIRILVIVSLLRVQGMPATAGETTGSCGTRQLVRLLEVL